MMMKHVICMMATATFLLSGKAQNDAGKGYKIELQVTPFQNQWVYLAYYYGGIKGLADSAFLDANSRGVLTGAAPLPQGVYILASPTKTILFEMLIPEDQVFSISADTLNMDGTIRFTGSAENELFRNYTQFLGPRAQASEQARQQLAGLAAEDPARKALEESMAKNFNEINNYRLKVMQDHPESMLTLLFKGMQEVPLPPALQNPKSRQDSLEQYRFAKAHFWDNFDLMDGRLVRTPIFEPRLKAYLNNWVSPDADSIIYEQNWMMALGRNDDEMFRYLVSYFIDNYIYPKVMGHDKVFLHTYERYVANNNPATAWLNETQRKTITERAYMVMANQLGGQAYDMALVDTAGKTRRLYDLKNDFVVISFWDPHCGKCKEELPRIDSFYNASWKKNNVQVYAVMVNEESAKEWKPFIENTGKGWVHVHQTKAMRDEEEKTGQANFRQLYDMRSTPSLFLLDKDKRIIAKNIGLEDLDKVLLQKIEQIKK